MNNRILGTAIGLLLALLITAGCTAGNPTATPEPTATLGPASAVTPTSTVTSTLTQELSSVEGRYLWDGNALLIDPNAGGEGCVELREAAADPMTWRGERTFVARDVQQVRWRGGAKEFTLALIERPPSESATPRVAYTRRIVPGDGMADVFAWATVDGEAEALQVYLVMDTDWKEAVAGEVRLFSLWFDDGGPFYEATDVDFSLAEGGVYFHEFAFSLADNWQFSRLPTVAVSNMSGTADEVFRKGSRVELEPSDIQVLLVGGRGRPLPRPRPTFGQAITLPGPAPSAASRLPCLGNVLTNADHGYAISYPANWSEPSWPDPEGIEGEGLGSLHRVTHPLGTLVGVAWAPRPLVFGPGPGESLPLPEATLER